MVPQAAFPIRGIVALRTPEAFLFQVLQDVVAQISLRVRGVVAVVAFEDLGHIIARFVDSATVHEGEPFPYGRRARCLHWEDALQTKVFIATGDFRPKVIGSNIL